MTSKKKKKILLFMPPFWDPICPPMGIVCLKVYLELLDYEVHIFDFNTTGRLYSLQKKYFDIAVEYFPHWKFLNILRNGPRYFVRHQMAWLNRHRQEAKYNHLVKSVLNIDGKSIFNDQAIEKLDTVLKEQFCIVKEITADIIHRIKPDVIGCTMLESTFPSALAILKEAKEIDPAIVTVLGGPGVLTGNTVKDGNLQRVAKQCEWVDAILFGESERLFANYLENNCGKKMILSSENMSDCGSGSGMSSEDRLLNVNDIPVPNYDGLLVQKYLWLSVFASRGCPFKCSFCFEKDYWEQFRKKSVERVISEMDTLAARYNKNKFYICDSLMNHIVTPLSEALIAQNKEFHIDCYLRITPDCLNEQKVQNWARGGIERVRLGIESTSPDILKSMNKNISPDNMATSLKNFSDNGIFTSTLWIAGFPGEEDKHFQDSVNFLEKNHQYIYQADMWEFICTPDLLTSSNCENSAFHTKYLYPEEFDDLLLIKHYEAQNGGGSPERFERISKFDKMRLKMGIPNPYTIQGLVEAHKRWVKLDHLKEERSYF